MYNLKSCCSQIIFGSLAFVFLIFILDYYFSFFPINGVYLFLYLFTVSLISMCVTFSALQNLLGQNKPLDYTSNIDSYKKLLQHMGLLQTSKPHKLELMENNECFQEDLEKRIQAFAEDIEEYYVRKWYRYISSDVTFGLESRILIADITRRFLQVVVTVDGKKLLHGTVTIILSHLKEYRRALKRVEKSGGTVEELYRYSHVGSKSTKSQEHFIHQLTTALLRQFINWELWNSLPCRTLVSILARKLINYLLILLSKPGLLNYKVLKTVANPDNLKFRLEDFAYVSLSSFEENSSKKTITLEQPAKKISTLIEGSRTPKDSPRKSGTGARNIKKVPDVIDAKVGLDGVANVEKKENVEELGKMCVSEPIKIYESRKSDATWGTTSELECISLGQDVTNLLDDSNEKIQGFIDNKLWDDVEDIDKNTKPQDDKVTDLPAVNFSTTATMITNTIKPIGAATTNTLQNMKEFHHSTVSSVVKPVTQVTSTAMHKIGDLQDEAAGVMEGILDFGMAGIRKGLRLTGLQDNVPDGGPKTKHDPKTVIGMIKADVQKLAHPVSNKLPKWQPVTQDSKVDDDESIWVNPIGKDSPTFDGHILLEKTPSLEGKSLEKKTDSTDSDSKCNTFEIPQISMDSNMIEDSPEIEYEEPADFATTIAKLRSLLQQKSSESSGTTPAVSPLPADDSFAKDSESDAAEIDGGVMPSIYKFCAKTATDVFQNTLNTIKTALPGNVPEHAERIMPPDGVDNWTYVTADVSSTDFISQVQKLLAERREFCTVDTAYEAIDSLNLEVQATDDWSIKTQTFDDELDDFDQKIPITKALVEVMCELLCDTDPWLVQETVVKSVLLLVGNHSESFLNEKAEWLVRNINKFVGRLPQNENKQAVAMNMDAIVGHCCDACPYYLKCILGEQNLSGAIRLFLSSLQSQSINQDVFLQIFELVTFHVIQASNMMTPAFSA